MNSIATRIQSLYTRQGTRPRFFIRIPDANLFLATQSLTDAATAEAYADKVQRLGTITETMDWLGGIGSVSGVNMDSIQLGQRITLCTEANIEPESQSAYAGAGRLICTGSSGGAYADTRNATACTDFGTPSISVGRIYNAGGEWFTVIRGFVQFKVPAGITSLDDAYIALTGSDNGASTAFTIQGVAGTWSNLTAGTGLFNDFAGWAASGTYGVTNLLETWTTAEYGATNYLRFNEAGRAAIKAAAGGTFRMILISSRDTVMDSGPSGNEYVTFESASARLALRYNATPLENADAEIYLDYVNDSGATGTTYTEMQLVRKYLVDDYSITDSALSLNLRDNNFRHDPMIPSKVITLDDWPNCPEENVGKAVPIAYGSFALTTEHRAGTGNFYGYGPLGTQINFSYPDAFLAYIVKESDDDRTALASLLKLKSGNAPLHLWNSSEKNFTLFPVRTSVATYTAGTGTSRDITEDTDTSHIPPVLCETIYKGVATVIPSGNESTAVTYPERAYDTETGTYATLSSNLSELILYFQDPDGITTDGAVVYEMYAEFTLGADATKLGFTLQKNTSDDPASPSWSDIETTYPWTADGQGFYAFYVLDASNNRTRLVLSQYRIKLTRTGDMSGFVSIYDACALVAYSVQNPDVLYMSGDGHYDDGSGTITGTPAALIENPSHIIESLLRDAMSLTAADIDTAAFDTAASTLSAWKFAFQLIDRKKASDYLDDLAKQCKSRVFWDSSDTLTIRTFTESNTFPVSGTNVPSGLDIFDTTGTPSGGSFTTNPILPGSLKIERVSMDEVYNDFVLKYKKNYASGEYAELLYMTNGAGTVGSVETNMEEANLENSQTLTALKTLCADNYTLYGATRTLTFEAWAIRDTATATKLLQYLIERTAVRRYLVTLTTKFTAIRHELGDFINIRDARVVDLFGTATAYIKKWEIIEKETDLDNCEITITAVEV